MTTPQVIEAIQKQIDAVSPIVERLDYIKAFPAGLKAGGKQFMAEVCYDSAEIGDFEEKIDQWQYATKTVLVTCFGVGSEHVQTFENSITHDRIYRDAKVELERELKKGRTALSSIIEAESLKTVLLQTADSPTPQEEKTSKPPKVFISHKKEDKAYADALVNLINNILGPDGDKIFCSSIPGYGIKQSRVIIDELKVQFDQFDVFMVIIHSPRYYQSAICLNEMGASWVLGTQFSSFLTKDFTPSQMKGVIGNDSIVIDLNDDQDVLNAHLNDFKNDLLNFFKSDRQIDENKWETARSRFVKEVSVLTYDYTSKTEEDLFEKLYLPAFDHIFDLLDIDHFSEWGYDCAIGGYSILKQNVYYNLDAVAKYIRSRTKHSSFVQWDSLILNLGQLIVDFGRVFSIHAVKLRDDAYYVEPFYKAIPNNPNYDRDVEAYQQHVLLISDLLFEMARLCNLILFKIRLFIPAYKAELGVLFLENDFSVPDLVYQDSEVSDAPYPGIDVFIRERLNRETHYGNNPNIRADGYEK